MKRNKVLILVITMLITLALGSAAYFAWFFVVRQSQEIKIDTATIDIEGISVNMASNLIDRLPGDIDQINDKNKPNQATLVNTGTRKTIVEISVAANDVTGTLDQNNPYIAEKNKFPNDYNGFYYKNTRLYNIIGVMFPDLDDYAHIYPNKWYRRLETAPYCLYKYYTYLDEGESLGLDDIYVYYKGELGGGFNDGSGSFSPPRQFEQNSNFSVQFTVKAVQATREAVKDYLGFPGSELPDSFYID